MTTTSETEVHEDEQPAPITGSAKVRNGMTKLRARARGEAKAPPEQTEHVDTDAGVDTVVPGDTYEERSATAEDDTKEKRFERMGAAGPSRALRQVREEDDKNILSWLSSMAADAPIRVSVLRKEPRAFVDPATGMEKKVDGLLKRYDRVIDEEEIQRNHGGGTYQLQVTKQNKMGRYEYFAAKTIEIAGDPKLNDVNRLVAPVAPQPQQQQQGLDPVVARVFDHVLADSRRPPPAPPDISAAVRAAVAPYEMMMQQMQADAARRDAEMRELRKGDPAQNDFTHRMLDKFVDQDSARLQQVRTQFESEIRMIKDQAIANEQRLRDQFERDKEHLYRAHERELSTTKSANDLKVAALEQSFAMQKSVLESENRRLEREVNELRVDVKELRNKKEPSFRDQIAGIRDMKEVLEDVVGGGDDEKEEKSTVVKVLEGAAQSDVIAGFAQRLMAGAQQQAVPVAQPQYQQQIPAPPRRRGPKLIRDKRNGQVYATDGRSAIPVKRKDELPPAPPQQQDAAPPVEGQADPAGAAQAAPAETPVATEAPIPYIPPETVAVATDYMSKAFGNNIDPGTFVTGIRMFIPAEIVEAIRQMGPEDFLRRVGCLPDEHPLLTQAGKNWARKVGKHLVGEG